MTTETIPGTRDIAQRLVNADEHFLALIMESGFTRDEAETIFAMYRKHKCIKREGLNRWTVKHGGFWDHNALVRALDLGNAGE